MSEAASTPEGGAAWRTVEAVRCMGAFAARTGLTSHRGDHRYLWTDAFAVCNFLALARRTGEADHQALAMRLIDRVHATLGRHRAGDGRAGWLSGLAEDAGAEHPTRGGLRIGKPLPERRPDEPFDERLEWERDGQYFHYLTKWALALDQAARATADRRPARWARELLQTAYEGFLVSAGPHLRQRLAWKMSIDLSRPLVPQSGQHDPLDGYLTCAQLRATAAALEDRDPPALDDELTGLRAMVDARALATTDPLGLGGLLMDACRAAQLLARGAPIDASLPATLLETAHAGVVAYVAGRELRQPAEHRLAFRELGLAIGLQAVDVLEAAQARGEAALDPRATATLRQLRAAVPLAAAITSHWLDPAHQRVASWSEHLDINEVMLATSLVPEGVLVLS